MSEDQQPSPLEIRAGQVWALYDRRHESHRYPRVVAIEDDKALVRNGKRHSRIALKRFGAKNRDGLRYCGHDGPGVLPAFEKPGVMGCLHAGVAPTGLPLTAVLAVGFGQVTVTRDDRPIYQDDDETMTLAQFEEQAKREPGDWRVRFEGPLSERLYQRHGDGLWVLVFQGYGFA